MWKSGLSKVVGAVLFVSCFALRPSGAQSEQGHASQPKVIKVTLLGTAAGPPVRLNRYQMSTLVEAGGETLLFDCGRGTTLRLAQAGIPLAAINSLFITHLHSDHIVDIPDLYLSGWVSRNQRMQPIEVWGPAGTRSMMDHLQEAFAFDIHIRRDVDEHFSAEGIKVISHDVDEGIAYEKNGVKVTSFLVDHGPVKPALGYRVDYAGHSVVISGDTRPSENLVSHSKGVDVLIHETLPGTALRSRSGNMTSQQVEAIIAHHSSPEQAGEIFTRVKPRLAVFSHYPDAPDIIAAARKTYSGPLELGQDLMTIEIGEKVTVGRAATQQASASPSTPQMAAASDALPPAEQPQLSSKQKSEAIRIILGAKERGNAIAERLATNAKLFDEVLLGEKADVEADANAASQIKAAICDSSETRLQAARQVVHLLTGEQRRYLKSEMAKPDSEHGILEAFAKVFHIEVPEK
jgi:ribonuclease Z